MGRRLIRPACGSGRAVARRDARRRLRRDRRSPTGATIDWPAHLHQIEIDGIPVNYVDIGSGATASRSVFVHGLGGQWQNWLENIPRLGRRTGAWSRSTCPASGCRQMPAATRITIPRLRPHASNALLRPARPRARSTLVGNSMGGFIAAEVAIQFPERVERLVLVSAAGITSAETVQRADPDRRAAIAAGARAVQRDALPPAGGAARSRATWRSRSWRATRGCSKPDLAYEGFIKGAGKPGFDDAPARLLDYDFRDRLPEIRLPDADRLGRAGLDHPGPRRRRVRAPDPGQPQGRHGGHRPRADGRAPAGVQRRAGGLPRRGAGAAEEKEPDAGRSRRPPEAPAASSVDGALGPPSPRACAYLPSTPFV